MQKCAKLGYTKRMFQEKTPVITSEDQSSMIGAIRDFQDYEDFYEKSFEPDNWIHSISSILQIRSDEIMPDQNYFQFIGLISLLFLQHGFISMEGHLIRHRTNRWKTSPLSRRHLLALASYGGHANNQTYPIRSDWERELKPVIPDEVLGTWGLTFSLRKGQIIQPTASLDVIQKAVVSRWKSKCPIYLPMQDVNQGLAQLNFSGNDAELMTQADLNGIVLPKAKKVIIPVIDLEKVFLPNTY